MGAFRLPAQTRLGAVHLVVSDAEKVLGFYRDVLGLEARPDGSGSVRLATPDGPPLVWLHERPEGTRATTAQMGLYHLAILLPAREDVGQLLMRLGQTGYPLGGASDHGVSEALYLADPEGNGIEIYADRPRAQWPVRDGALEMGILPLALEDLVAAARARGGRWSGLPAGTIIGHIHLHVGDLDTAGPFFVEGLGFDLMQRYGTQAMFVSAGGYHHHVGLNTWAGRNIPPKRAEQPGLLRYEIFLPDASALVAVMSHLETLDNGVRRDGEAIVLSDPTGSEVVLMAEHTAERPV